MLFFVAWGASRPVAGVVCVGGGGGGGGGGAGEGPKNTSRIKSRRRPNPRVASLYSILFGDRRPCTTACTSFWAMGTHKLKQCTVREKKILYWADRSSQYRIKVSHRHEEPNEGPLSFVLCESPFTSVSRISRVNHSLISNPKSLTRG
jgi:hypothetical protein